MIFELMIILWLPVIISRAKETASPRYVGCVLKQKNWITYDYLLIKWAIPQSLLDQTSQSDIQVFAEWTMEENYGSCGEVNMTSCIMHWNKSGSVNFNSDFNLTVSIVTADKETLFVSHWWIHIKSCRQPPKVARLSAASLNSSCIYVNWSFANDESNDQGCSNYFFKTYRVRYKEYQHSNSPWSILKVMPENGDSCQGSKVICGLVPYTFYEIGVECRNSEKDGTEYGVWSDVNAVREQTEEDVPSAAPEVTPGSFSYAKRDCDVSNTRNIDFYWKNIPEEFRNGRLKGVEVEINQTNMKTPVLKVNISGENPVSSASVLACSTSYLVSLKAFTDVGLSNMESSLFIPKDENVLDIVADIVPTVSETGDVMIDWIFHRNVTVNVTGYSVFWCRKTLDRTCKSDFNWVEVPTHQQHYLLRAASLSSPAHKYIFGVSVQSYNNSSGVLWSRCLYAEDTDIQPPSNIRLIDDKVEGTLHVQWDTLSCDHPYILQYLAYICVLDSGKKNCSGEMLRREMAGSETSVKFTDLDPSNVYRIYIVAVTRSNITSTRSIEGEPYIEGIGLTVAQKAGIIIGALVAVVLVIVGIVAISRRIQKRCCSVTDIPDILEQQAEFLPSAYSVVRQFTDCAVEKLVVVETPMEKQANGSFETMVIQRFTEPLTFADIRQQ